MFVQWSNVPHVQMLPTQQELYCDTHHLCLHPVARHHHCLHHAVAGGGPAAEEGRPAERLFTRFCTEVIVWGLQLKWSRLCA